MDDGLGGVRRVRCTLSSCPTRHCTRMMERLRAASHRMLALLTASPPVQRN